MPDTIKELTNIRALSAGPIRAFWGANRQFLSRGVVAMPQRRLDA
jgi:hypothetical protein